MKRMILITTVAALVFGCATMAGAGDKEWATAGKILAGITAYQFLSGNMFPQQNVYYAPQRGYYYEPRRHYSAPRRHYYAPRSYYSSYYAPSTYTTTTYYSTYSEPVVIVEEDSCWW
ncbi:MAG: hypothetical protein JW728_00485 [Candidatus Aureabacteria bacterium]|nr:hypothetical protein [Candidatus Auribacterota bacterium]